MLGQLAKVCYYAMYRRVFDIAASMIAMLVVVYPVSSVIGTIVLCGYGSTELRYCKVSSIHAELFVEPIFDSGF